MRGAAGGVDARPTYRPPGPRRATRAWLAIGVFGSTVVFHAWSPANAADAAAAERIAAVLATVGTQVPVAPR